MNFQDSRQYKGALLSLLSHLSQFSLLGRRAAQGRKTSGRGGANGGRARWAKVAPAVYAWGAWGVRAAGAGGCQRRTRGGVGGGRTGAHSEESGLPARGAYERLGRQCRRIGRRSGAGTAGTRRNGAGWWRLWMVREHGGTGGTDFSHAGRLEQMRNGRGWREGGAADHGRLDAWSAEGRLPVGDACEQRERTTQARASCSTAWLGLAAGRAPGGRSGTVGIARRGQARWRPFGGAQICRVGWPSNWRQRQVGP